MKRFNILRQSRLRTLSLILDSFFALEECVAGLAQKMFLLTLSVGLLDLVVGLCHYWHALTISLSVLRSTANILGVGSENGLGNTSWEVIAPENDKAKLEDWPWSEECSQERFLET